MVQIFIERSYMTTMEIEARKVLLIREIKEFVHRLKGETTYTMPSSLLKEFMLKAEKEDSEGLCITSDELDKEMQSW